MLKKVLTYIGLSSLSVVILYTTYWFISVATVKSLLLNISSVKTHNSGFIYTHINVSGFPFLPKFRLDNPKIYNIVTSLQADSLVIHYNIFRNFFSFAIPQNKFHLSINDNVNQYSVSCHTQQGPLLSTQIISNLLFLINKIKSGDTVLNYIKFIKYQDQGLTCKSLNNNNINNSSNFINMVRKDNKHFSIIADLNNQQKSINKQLVDYPSLNVIVNFNYIVDSAIKINAKIDKILLSSKEFTIKISGLIENFNIFTQTLSTNIAINIHNYKEAIEFLINTYSLQKNEEIIQKFQELIYNISDKIDENDIKFSLCDENNKNKTSCNISFAKLIQKSQLIYNRHTQLSTYETFKKN